MLPPAATDVAHFRSMSGLDREQLIRAFRLMYMSRRIDDREILLKRQNQIYFQISGAGHEAIQIAAGMAARPGYDWFYPYYRDRASGAHAGRHPGRHAAAGGGRRSRPRVRRPADAVALESPELHIVTGSSPTGTQFVQAVGCANASSYVNPGSDEITLVSAGEGATSEGEFWESMNIACLESCRLLFLIEDNGYAISVPVERQTAGGSISRLVCGLSRTLFVVEVDGTDFIASYRAMSDAGGYCASGAADPRWCMRMSPGRTRIRFPTMSAFTRPRPNARAEAARDPLVTFPEWLIREGCSTGRRCSASSQKSISTVQRSHRARAASAGAAPRDRPCCICIPKRSIRPPTPSTRSRMFQGEPRTMVDPINPTLPRRCAATHACRLRRRRRRLQPRRESARSEGQGRRLQSDRRLADRVRQRSAASTRRSPKPRIVGRAIGMATRGLKPVAEIQFFDYIWPAMMQIRDELATIRWRSNNGFSCPMVIRVPIGGYLNGGAIYHSQCGEVAVHAYPGPARRDAVERAGCLRAAAHRDPLRRSGAVSGAQAAVSRAVQSLAASRPRLHDSVRQGEDRRKGNSLTIVTYGALVQKAMLAAQQIEQRRPGASIEVIDLRTLSPYDWAAIGTSVRKTSRVVIAHEDCLSWGYGARDLGAHRERAVRLSRCAGRAGRRTRYLGRLQSAARRRNSAADRRLGARGRTDPVLLNLSRRASVPIKLGIR